MTEITADHVEWAVIHRLSSMLEGSPHENFNVTQTYALSAAILCWVMQRVRIKSHEIESQEDKIAHHLFKKLDGTSVADNPWCMHIEPTTRIELLYGVSIPVPAPQGFEKHSAGQFLINLRDAMAHGDARSVSPFNIAVGSERVLAGFSFSCARFKERKIDWEGTITLLEKDLRRIGIELAKLYCVAIRRSDRHRRDDRFEGDARSIKEAAA
jgi:hypothetical protein